MMNLCLMEERKSEGIQKFNELNMKQGDEFKGVEIKGEKQ